MSFVFHLQVVIVAMVVLLSAGCTSDCCRLQIDQQSLRTLAAKAEDHPEFPTLAVNSPADSRRLPTANEDKPMPSLLDETPLVEPSRFQGEVARNPLQLASDVSLQASPQAGAASHGAASREEPPETSPMRPISLVQSEQLPAPPSEVDRRQDEAEELPPVYSSTASEELIVVPIPPRPPGVLRRLLKFLGGNRFVGCAQEETAVALSIEAPAFSPSGTAASPDRWWKSFGDAALDRQVEYSLGDNFTLAAALERLRAAQALARREASDLWPDLNGFAEGEGAFRTFAPNDSFFALGLDASYQVDLWGQIRSRAEAERLRASATSADYHAVALTLSAEICRTWFTLIEAHAQRAVLDEQLETNVTGLKLQETRFGGGDQRVGSADVLRQRQLVESTRAQIIVVRSRIDVLEHRLAVLQGRAPQAATYDAGNELPALPPLPATGLPSELVQRRPDVRRDYLALLAADRDLASAITARYPRLNLAGSLSTLADSGANLFRDWILVIAGQVVGPLIDGGQRRAEVDRTAAVLRQLVADYGQTVLIAFSEVEDALALERYQRQRLESLDKQYNLARQASEQLRDRYFGFGEEIGETEYLDVLTATTTEQQLQRDILSARLDLILTRIALYLALAGGFDPHPQVIVGDSPSDSVIDERQPETALITPLDSDPHLVDRLPVHFRGGSHSDRGD